MLSPFPGMDPYLERPSLWPNVHHELISGIRAALGQRLRPAYYVRIEERVYVSGPADPGRNVLVPDLHRVSRTKRPVRGAQRPARGARARAGPMATVAEPIVAVTLRDDQVRESYLEVIEAASRKVVTVIEVLSPSNKVAGADGMDSFLEKRNQVMRSSSHWMEIDLLRAGISPVLPGAGPEREYLVHVSPVERRPEGLIWPIRLSQPLPIVPVPLLPEDEHAPLDLQEVLDTSYDRAGYDQEIDYTKEPVPPFGKRWKGWADRLLREQGPRARETPR